MKFLKSFAVELGVRKIKLDLQDNEDEVFKKLCCGDIRTGDDEENLPVGYPQLADCGGFELMVCQSNSRQLTVLDCTPSTRALRARIGGSQSKVNIRPIQKNLSLKPIVKVKTFQRTDKCFNCCKEFPVSLLRMHALSYKPSMEFGLELSSCSEDDKIFNLDPFTTKSTGGIPAATQCLEDVPLWSYICRNVPDHFRTKIGRITYLNYFGTAISDKPLELGSRGKIPEKLILWIII